MKILRVIQSSNNTNKLSPQEHDLHKSCNCSSSNNTNKLSPQELGTLRAVNNSSSNNTNKLSPQERHHLFCCVTKVQIIQINLVLKNNQLLHLSLLVFK